MEQLEIMLSNELTKLYAKNEDENYRQALKDVSFCLCKYFETHGIGLNKTDLTVEWLESVERKQLRRKRAIK